MTIGFGPSAPFDYYPDSMPIPDQFDIHALIELSQEIGVAVQTGTPVVPELESFEDHRVSLLEVQIASAVTKSFLNQLTTEAFAQCKHELAHLLESCKAILNPSQKLQFLRHVASEFLSENTSFSCEFASQPNLLPAGFALSWVANQPVTVTVTNPAARVLLRHRLLPTEYSDHYSAFIESLILGCALQFNPKERSELILTFGQLYTQFEYRFYPNQFLIHFFLSHILRVHDLYPQRDLCMYYRYNLIPTVYKQSDQRLAGDCTVKHLFLDNLVLSGDITKFARFSIKNDALAYKLLEYYVSQLITFGVTDSEIMLSNEIVLTLFTILSLFGGNIQERVLTNISRAYESITKKDPGLSLEIAKLFDVKQLCERHTISEIETSSRQQISLLPFPSIIIRNLQIKMGIDLQRLPVSKPALPQNNIAWQEISQYLQSFATPSNHTIINQEKLHLTLLRGFLPFSIYLNRKRSDHECDIRLWKSQKKPVST